MSTISRQLKPVAFLDLAALHQPLRERLDAAWRQTVDESAFIGAASVTQFEQRWADYCGTAHCVGVANGTDALELVLAALDIGVGDEVIVPANTFVATAEAVVTAGATPVFVDVDPSTLLVTPELVAEAVTPATKAAMIVHLYGQIPDMRGLAGVADEAGIHLIEDAAQAHGATFDHRPAGSFGIAATFSFYPGKNLGALGDAGAVVTNDEEVAERVRTLANHGRGHHLLHTYRGRNSRLDGIQAAALCIKLDHLDDWNSHRRTVHQLYLERFADSPIEVLQTIPGSLPVHHLEVIRLDDRDRVRDELERSGIQTGIHYALPCHKHPAFAELDRRPLPVAERAAGRQMSIPMHPTLKIDEAHMVASALMELL